MMPGLFESDSGVQSLDSTTKSTYSASNWLGVNIVTKGSTCVLSEKRKLI